MFSEEFFARLRGIKMAHCQFTKVHQWNPPESRHSLFSSLAAAQQIVIHYLWSRIYWLRLIKHKSICKRPQKNRQHCRPNRAHKKRSEINFRWTDEETVRQRWARTGREQKSRKTTEDNIVLPQSVLWPMRTRESTPANANSSILAKNPSRSWVFWAEPKSAPIFAKMFSVPELWNSPAIISTYPARTDAKAATARERW